MSNRLKDETSPYLLQHAENPVDWHPWDAQSLELARRDDKPILLSVGYSACHWCHVMAHESFEDEATARVMNDLFVNIKVDREERPDLDRIYQIAHQMFMGRGGGWPLTVFLTPNEHLPIFAGTYFPKTANYGMPAFQDVLTRVESYYRSHPTEILDSGSKLVAALERMNADTASQDALGDQTVARARQRLGESFDAEHGGFGQAPKFPHPTNIDLLIEVGARARLAGNDDVGAKRMVEHSLERMASRGLYDHLGGGFFRYSVDARWAIPHFEKMLYDNAALLGTYSDAAAWLERADFARVASETADWVLRDMQDAQGGFYATLDADSEGHEGKFYVWTPEQVDAVLDSEQAALAKRYYGLEAPANFEQHFWHLQRTGDEPEPPPPALDLCRAKLLAAREQRVWPGRDEKVLVAWNGLMIIGLARAARFLGRPELATAATRAVDFIHTELWSDGRLKAAYKDGRARFAAYLDDYAFLALGLVELMQTRFRAADLRFAVDLVDVLLEHFADDRGGFFFTADDHERLIHRPKPLGDEAIPSGNGMAALALSALGHLLGEPRYLDAASGTLRAAQASIERFPEAHATLLEALQLELTPPELVIVRADEKEAATWRPLLDVYRPGRLSFLIPDDAGPLPGVLAERAGGDSAVAYVCRGLACSSPIETPEALAETLDRAQ